MSWLVPPVAAGLWIFIAFLAGLTWYGAAGVGIRADGFGLWMAASAAIAIAIVATRGAPSSRLWSEALVVASAVASVYVMLTSSSGVDVIGGVALATSVAIAVLGARPWVRSKQPD